MLIGDYHIKKVSDILRFEKPKKVCLVFWHGLGDLVMFLPCLKKLRELFHNIQIDIALQDGVGQEDLIKTALLINNPNRKIDGYEYTFQIHFPMCESNKGLWTKSEWCCLQELGIEPISNYPIIENKKSKLVACHFQATALPGNCNPDEKVANIIWNEIIESGFIPIESLFQHKFFNGVNKKFKFIDRDVRNIKPSINNLISLLQNCYASICVASGNLPLSIAIMPEKTLYLKKDFEISSYTKKRISTIDINNYKKGNIKEWLQNL